MATAYNIPTSSLGKIQRWYNAQKAAGRKISPWELEAAYRGELGNLSGQQTTNRQITLNEKQAEEVARMNEVNTALARERMATEKDLAEKNLALNAQRAEREEAHRQEQLAIQKRMEERQKQIDEFEQTAYKDRTKEDKARYEQNRIDQAADRDAMKSAQLTASLGGIGTMAGLSLLLGKDASGATGAGKLVKGIGNLFSSDTGTSPTIPSTTPSDLEDSAGGSYMRLFGAGEQGGVPGGDLTGLGDFNYDPALSYAPFNPFDYDMASGGYNAFDYGMNYDDYGLSGLSFDPSLLGSGLDWGSDWATGVDWSAFDAGGWLY